MGGGILPAVHSYLFGAVKESVTRPDHTRRNGHGFQRIAVGKRPVRDLPDTLRNHQLRDTAVREHVVGDLFQRSGKLDIRQGGTTLEGRLADDLQGIRKHHRRQILAVEESLAADLRDAVRHHDLPQAAVHEHTVTQKPHLTGQLDGGECLAVPEAVFLRALQGLRQDHLCQGIAVAERISMDGVDTLGNFDPFQAAVLEAAPGDVGDGSGELDLLQALTAGEAVIKHRLQGLGKLYLFQIQAAGKGILRDVLHALRDNHRGQAGAAEHTVGDQLPGLGDLHLGQRLRIGENIFPELDRRIRKIQGGQLLVAPESEAAHFRQSLRQRQLREAAVAEAITGNGGQGRWKIDLLQRGTMGEAGITKLRQPLGKLHTGELLAVGKGKFADGGHALGEHDLLQCGHILKGIIPDPGDSGGEHQLLHRLALLKGIFPNRFQSFRQVDRLQHIGILEGMPADFLQGLGQNHLLGCQGIL